MKVAIEVYVSLLLLALTMAICVGLIGSDLSVMRARDDYYSYVNELQESNFADTVVEACKEDATADGYGLDIQVIQDETGKRSANVVLTYEYRIVPLGISQNKTIRGFVG